MRPTITELFTLKHSDITIADKLKHLFVRVRNGKTSYCIADTRPGAVSEYGRIKKRNPDAKAQDFIFLPGYPNRSTAPRISRRQFNFHLEQTGLNHDEPTGKDRRMCRLRHIAICIQIILAKGDVNINSLAKNAGTSFDQIERF